MSGTLLRLGDALRGLTGWQAWFTAIAAGAVLALGFMPLDLFPAILLGMAALVLLLDGAAARPKPIRRAAALGWGFGFGQFVVGMYWIFYPFLVDPVEHAWQIPFVALLFPGGLALFATAACAAAMFFWKPGPSRVFAFTVCYAAAEWLRGHILSGLPWNLPAYGWGASLGVLQSAALLGAYGLSLLTILFGASLAELFAAPRRWLLPAVTTALFVVLWLGGEARLALAPTVFYADVRVRLVQPNIPQDQKYVPELRFRNWQTLMNLSTRQAGPRPTVIVWPEAAPPVLLQRAPDAMDQITILTGGTGRVLVTGNQRIDVAPDGHRRFYNSLYVFDRGGALTATYDKFHLVPFGEYLPLEPLMKSLGVTELVGFPGSFTAGDGPHTLHIPGAPDAGPLICYEILFPGAVVDPGNRPGWLINVTDDSWFGPWAGPRQHLLAARVRAIEEGLPVARAANTGISAMIDPAGRTVSSLDLGRAGVVDSRLPRAFSATPYTRFGDFGFGILLLLCAGLSWVLARRVQAS
ncbi:MAG TPA: apolipoprotein N-acyltransferase [Rhizomicrobium sp.]|nr:apolipoprotein N-acyltransferase [Rhizomicrobium sp.]